MKYQKKKLIKSGKVVWEAVEWGLVHIGETYYLEIGDSRDSKANKIFYV